MQQRLPATHATLAPAPATPNNAGAVAAAGAAPIATIDPPKTTVPPPSAGTSRRRPTRPTARADPTRPPRPEAELRKPAHPWPLSSSEIATATNRTSSAPHTTIPPDSTSTSRPAWRSAEQEPEPAEGLPDDVAARLIGARGSAPTAEIPSRETSAALDERHRREHGEHLGRSPPARISPPMNGPTTMPAFSAKEETAFAAVSSSGLSETLGSSAACVGRGNDIAAVAVVAITASSGERSVGERAPRSPERHRHREVADEQDATAPEPIAGERAERRDHPGGDQLDRGDGAGRRRAAAVVGVDEDRDPRAALPHREPEEREHEPAQPRIACDPRRDPDLLVHGRRMAPSGCARRSRPGGC